MTEHQNNGSNGNMPHAASDAERILARAENISSERSMDGFRLLEFREDGVYLGVYPPQKDGEPIDANFLIDELKKRQVADVDYTRVRQITLEATGTMEKIAPPQPEMMKDAEIVIDTSKDKMEAYLTIYPPQGGKKATAEDIRQALAEKGIVFGIREEVISTALTLDQVSEPVVIAKGVEPLDGEPAKIQYNFLSKGMPGKPQELADGRVDFYNLNLIQNVDEGQILAVKTPATPGTPGSNVFGEEVPAKPGKDTALAAGKNAELIDDGLAVVARSSGHVVMSGNQISISAVYEVKGDVDFNTGNIDFNGSVIVKGAVREGFSVKAVGDVDVNDVVAGGQIVCSGHLKVKNGIVRSNVVAQGNIFTRFIENSTIQSGDDVVVGEAIMHSQVNARKTVTVGGKGVIVGGKVRAGEEISAKIIGSHLATVTELEAGVSPELRSEYKRLKQEYQQKNEDLDKALKAITLLQHMQATMGQLPEDKKAILVKVTRTHFELVKEIEALKSAMQNVEFQIDQSDRGRILVQGVIHPGVKITIGSVYMNVQDPYQFVALTRDGEDIKFSPYK